MSTELSRYETSQLSHHNARKLATGLGWFSIGLGLAELLAPGAIDRQLRTGGRVGLLRFFGLREILSGIGILQSSDPKPWIISRIAGDAADIATLMLNLRRNRRGQQATASALAAVLGVTVLDLICAASLSKPRR